METDDPIPMIRLAVTPPPSRRFAQTLPLASIDYEAEQNRCEIRPAGVLRKRGYVLALAVESR